MEFRLKITCNTAAFGEKPELQLASILHGIANTVEYIGSSIEERPTVRTPVADVNGIRVGAWELKR